MTTTNKPVSYAEAIGELEQILRELEGDGVDIDVLASKTQRAGLLLAFCRERLKIAETEVTQLTAQIADSGAAPTGQQATSDVRAPAMQPRTS